MPDVMEASVEAEKHELSEATVRGVSRSGSGVPIAWPEQPIARASR